MTHLLYQQITPLLDEFKRANGRGNVNIANLALVKIIETLVEHIDSQQIAAHKSHENLLEPCNEPTPTVDCWETLVSNYALAKGWNIIPNKDESAPIAENLVAAKNWKDIEPKISKPTKFERKFPKKTKTEHIMEEKETK